VVACAPHERPGRDQGEREPLTTILNDRAVTKLEAPEHGRLEVLDAKMPGHALRITPRGHKSWTVVWHQDRRARRHAIGTYPAMTLATAREKARQVLAGLARGEDPIAARTDARFAPTFTALAADYIERHAKARKRS